MSILQAELNGEKAVAKETDKGALALRAFGYAMLSWLISAAICAFGTWLMYGEPSTGGMPLLIVAIGVSFACSKEAGNFEKLGRFSLIGGLAYTIVYCCMINAGNM